MLVFRLVLGAMLAVLFAFTAKVFANAGPDLFSVFFGDIARVGWPGQFDLDFMFMLGLSAFWVAWRHRFSAAGLGLAVLAFFGGSSFLGVYLIVQSLRCRGDAVTLLVGDRAGS